MSIKVAALYQFVALPDFRDLRDPLRALCAELDLRGSLLLAEEGINGTIAGETENIDRLIEILTGDTLFAGRLNNLELKFSAAATMPFRRMKVRLKQEIVRLDAPEVDPNKVVGTYIDATDWNALIDDPDTIVIDTRNEFEVAIGTFTGAVDPKIASFSAFKDFVKHNLDPAKHKKVAMFCTGGIRCEKASSYMLTHGFEQVFHLKGGILKYLETMPEAETRWEGGCFVFDERIALGHGLKTCEVDDPNLPINSEDYEALKKASGHE